MPYFELELYHVQTEAKTALLVKTIFYYHSAYMLLLAEFFHPTYFKWENAKMNIRYFI